MLKVIELFGGIGAPRMALEMLGINYEVVDYVEIDKYAVKSYNAIYNENFVPRDIQDYHYNDTKEIDLIFHGSPCQDFSVAGKQAGGEKYSGTRSSLLWETLRIVKETKPKWIIWENVPNVLNKKHIPIVDQYIKELEDLGYVSDYRVLNAIDYGVPQHRKRVFCVSKNIGNVIYWPEELKLKQNLHDKLEKEPVDEKYYYSDEQSKDVVLKHQGESYCIDANYFKGTSIKGFQTKSRRQLVQVPGELGINGHDILKRVYDPEGSSPTLNAMTGGNRQPKVIVGEAHGVYTDQMNRKKASMEKESSVTIKAQSGHAGAVVGDGMYWRIRKLTPKECWRLMGLPDHAFKKAQEVCSNTRLYQQAGNSIVTNVIAAIYKANRIGENF